MDEKTLNALVNAIKNKDPKGLKAYENLLKIASSKPKNEEEQKNIEAAKGYVAEIKKRLTTKAAHGAKLDYVKSLKHICPEGLELVYFKKGGSVNCGCVGKKLEKGDKVEEAKCGTVAKFKKVKKVGFGSWITKLADATGSNGGFKKAEQESKKKSENNKRKPVTNVATLDKNPGSTKQPMQEALERARHKNDYNNLKKGGAVDKFKSAKCGSKMKKHKDGGSLNGVPFYLKGTPKEGITEKSDNTRVEQIPNKGEGIYEQIPVNGWDFVPGIGTYWEAKRLDQEDPNASVARFGISLAGDLAGAGMIGNVAKAAGRVSRIQKALKARGYQLFTKDGSLWFRLPKKIVRGYGDKLYTYEIPNIFGGSSFKTIPTVDYTPAVMAPLVLTLRVPAEAPFFNYSK